jgi:hypothetical protein
MDSRRPVLRWAEAGAGKPAVVLEAGMGNGAAAWQRVMPMLAPHPRVAAYEPTPEGLAANWLTRSVPCRRNGCSDPGRQQSR